MTAVRGVGTGMLRPWDISRCWGLCRALFWNCCQRQSCYRFGYVGVEGADLMPHPSVLSSLGFNDVATWGGCMSCDSAWDVCTG